MEPMEPTETGRETADFRLTAAEARVLGALMEKQATTPEYYPLSLNALLNACNQKNSREPVMQLTEDDVRQALHTLERKGLAGAARGSDSRVAKYEHRTAEKFNFRRDEAALVCVLLLRGPQTPGELRGRTDRIHQFEELEAVLAGLERLAAREPALARQLPRQQGMKEARWTQLLTGEPNVDAAEPQLSRTPTSDSSSDIQQLRAEIAELRERVEQLEARSSFP
jgi:uncharacterized protein YceH (UPF0502 family)